MTDTPRPEPTPAPGPPPAPRAPRRDTPVWAYLLIVAGVVLLIVNAGWLSFGRLFDLLALWPIALLAIGADLLTRGRYRLPIVAGAAVLTLVLWLTGAGAGGWGVGGTGEDYAIDHALEGARAAEVVLRLGVGDVDLDTDAGAGRVLTGTVHTGRNEVLNQTHTVQGGVVRVVLQAEQKPGTTGRSGDRRAWDLSLTRTVPVDLRIDAGVGDIELDLRDATLSYVNFSGGVGEVDVALPDRGGYTGEIDLGVGDASISIPRDVEARLRVSVGLGGVEVNGEWSREDRVYTTAGYASAPTSERIELTVNGGIGRVAIDRIR